MTEEFMTDDEQLEASQATLDAENGSWIAGAG